MILYDILDDGVKPTGLFEVAADNRTLVLRAVYDHTGIHSWLLGEHQPDGVHLFLQSPSGRTLRESNEPKHHHISDALMSRPKEYAALLNTSKFILESTRKPAFLKARFPDWTPIGFVRDDVYRMEYTLTW